LGRSEFGFGRIVDDRLGKWLGRKKKDEDEKAFYTH